MSNHANNPSHHHVHDPDCRFCNINPERTKIVEEFEHVKVILANPRLMPGHLLVIPKRHVERMSELNDAELLELIHVVNTYCDKVLKFAKGYMVKNNFMPFLEESRLKVNHMHIHILPRNFSDDLYTKALFNESTLYEDLSDEEYSIILKKLDTD